MNRITLLIKNIKYMSYRRFIINSYLKKNFLPFIKNNDLIFDIGGIKNKKTYFLNQKEIFENYNIKTINKYDEKNADIIANAENLPFKDESISSLIFIETIQYLNNPEKSLKEIKRVLKKNGLAAISFPFIYNELDDHIDRFRFTSKFILENVKDIKNFQIFNCGGLLSSIGQILQSKSYNSKNFKRIFLYYLSLVLFIFDIFFNNFNKKNIYTNGYIIFLKK